MSKSLKLKDNHYWDTKGIVHNKVALNIVLDDKVDKVSGKGLSTNDFTTAYKNKIDNTAGTQLYNNTNGSTGNITLSQTSANFTYIEIFYKDTEYNYYNSVKVYQPNGKNVNLLCGNVFYSDRVLMITTKEVTISGTAINNKQYGKFNSWNTTISNNNNIAIVRVMGYKN